MSAVTKFTSSSVSSPGLWVRERISRSAAEGESVFRCVMKGVSGVVSKGKGKETGGVAYNHRFRRLLEGRR